MTNTLARWVIGDRAPCMIRGGDHMADDFALHALDQIATSAEFAPELQALRARSGLTIREVARAAKTPVATTGDYFSGRHLPLDRDQLARILAACGETDPARIEQWQAALVRVRRSPGRRTGTPYRGLARFEAEDERWFFGREDDTELLAYLAGAPSTVPLLLIGPSGAGKSSLLRAGLLPRLRSAAADLAADPADVEGLIVVCDLTVTGVPGLTAQVDKMAAEATGDALWTGRSTVIVDQFEAVFTLCDDEGERTALIDGLCGLARTGLVVLALRADFYQQAIRYPVLRRAAQERHVVLGPMSAEQVRRAVVEPARLARTEVAAGLVEVLLADLAPDTDGSGAHEPGALPMLSHALLAAWQHSRGGTLTVADYLASGGIKDALTQSAERAYESLSPVQQRLARRLFLRLVHVADDLPPSRAAVPLDELLSGIGAGAADVGGSGGGADAELVLAVFIDERMISVDIGTARLTHDALLAAWPRLRGWIEESADELRMRRRISSGAQAWEETGREEAALWRGSQLAVAREWGEDPEKRAALLPLAGEFVAASVEAGTARERVERRRTTRLRSIVAVLTVLVVAVAGLTAYAFSQRQAATGDEATAIKAEVSAITERNQADSREAAFVADQLRGEDPSAAAQLSLSAYGIAPTPQAAASLLEASGTSSAARIVDSAGPVQWVSLSPDRRLLVAAGADGTLRLWNAAVPGHPTLVATLERADKLHPLYTVEFSPNGRVIAAAGAGRVVKLWELSGSDSGGSGNPALRVVPLGQPLTGPTNTIYSIALSPGGRLLAAGSADGTVRLWDVADPARATPVGRALKVPGAAGSGGYVESVAFSADGRTLAAGTSVKTVWLWNVSRPTAPAAFRGMPLRGPAGLISGVAFSPDGRTLAASSQDNKVWLWSVHAKGGTAGPDGTLAGATDWANAVAFSPDGRSLAEGTSDASVLVWNMATRAITATLNQPQPVTSVTWDGQNRIAASDADGTVALWSLPAPGLDTGNSPASVAYSPDGATLAVGGTSVQLWDVATHRLLVTHSLPPRVIANATAFSPTGAAVAVALSNGTVALLSARTLAPVGKPFIAISGQGAAESVAFSPTGALLLTGADDGSLRLFDVADPARPREVARVHDSGDSVYTVAFAPDGTTVAAASIDNLVRVWRVTGAGGAGAGGAGEAGLAHLGPALGGLASYAIGLAFSPDSKILAVGSADKTVRLWNVAQPAHPVQIGAPLTGPSGYVWAAAFSPDGKTLAVGVTDGTVWMWNVAQPAHPALIATLTGPAADVYSVAFSPSGAQLAATSFEGTVHLWDASPPAARAAICANLGQPLTQAEWSTYVPGLPYRAPCS
jgi:WD40 repeat protein